MSSRARHAVLVKTAHLIVKTKLAKKAFGNDTTLLRVDVSSRNELCKYCVTDQNTFGY
jgi:hypothetical protein